MRVLVGGIGYRNLRDHSIGAAVADRLMERSWPDGVVVEDVSYNPIALIQRLEDEPTERRFDRAILVSGISRAGRQPGTIAVYRWDGALPAAEAIHTAVTEAITGVIYLDNTLVVSRYFGALPNEVVVVEVEPALHEFGDALSSAVSAAFEPVCELVTMLATDAAAAARVAEAPLGGGMMTPRSRSAVRIEPPEEHLGADER